MALTRSILRKRVADFLGYTTDPTKWSDIQEDRIDRIIDKGYQEYLHPPRVDVNHQPHCWGFLRDSYTFSTVDGTDTYSLPQNFAYIIGPMTFLTQERYYETYIKSVGWGDIKIFRTAQGLPTKGLPRQYGIDMTFSNAPGAGAYDTNDFWYQETGGSVSTNGYYWPVHLTAEEAAFFDIAAGGNGSYNTVNFTAYSSLDFFMPATGATTANATDTGLPASYTSLEDYLTSPSSYPDVDFDTTQETSGGKLALYPTPDAVYQILFQYQKSATSFSTNPLGPDDFHILLEECVLSHAEKDLNDAYGIHRQTYMELLERMISHDKQMHPETFQNIGPMRETPYQVQHGQYVNDPRASRESFNISHSNQGLE